MNSAAEFLLAELAALGPFFSVYAHLPGERPEMPWLSVDELSRPEPMRRRIAEIGLALAAAAGTQAEQIDMRVAASTAHFGIVARLLSPALAALASGYELSTQPAELWWQEVLGAPSPLSVPVPPHRLDDRQPSAATACGKLVSELIEPVTSTVAEVVPMSFRVLWGNVASAVNSACLRIATKRPAAADCAQLLSEIVFAAPQLRTERSPSGPGFRRSSCCLIYRISAERGKGICGDCVLSRSPSS